MVIFGRRDEGTKSLLRRHFVDLVFREGPCVCMCVCVEDGKKLLAAASGYIQGKGSLIGFCIRWAHAGCYSGKHSIAFCFCFCFFYLADSRGLFLLSEKERPDASRFFLRHWGSRGEAAAAARKCVCIRYCIAVGRLEGGGEKNVQCGQCKMMASLLCSLVTACGRVVTVLPFESCPQPMQTQAIALWYSTTTP